MKGPLEAHQQLGVVVGAIKRLQPLKHLKPLLISLGALYGHASQAMELSKFKFLLNVFDQNGDQGYQVYDNSGNENLTVVAPMIFVAANVNEDTDVSAQFILDAWTAASDTALDGKTGASGAGIKNQARVAGQLGYKKGNEQNNWSTRLGVSSEYDYQSLNFGGTLVRSFVEDNFTLSISPQIFLDQAKDFDLRTQKTTEFKGRVIHSLDVSGAQLLTESDLLQVGYTYIGMNGYLNNITSKVRVLSEATDPYQRQGERLPSSRTRHAVSSKWVHGFSDDLAVHLAYRYYTDDWKIKAHSPEVGVRMNFHEGDSFLMPSYRYHTQTAAEFHHDFFTSSQALMTSDSDLAHFASHIFGLHYNRGGYDIEKWGYKAELDWNVGAYWTSRNNDMDYLLVQTGVGLAF